MTIKVYKGFDLDFLRKIEEKPIIEKDIIERINPALFSNQTRKNLELILLNAKDDDSFWVTYEEFYLAKEKIFQMIDEENIEVVIIKNNIMPDCYRLNIELDEETMVKLHDSYNGINQDDDERDINNYLDIYGAIYNIDGEYYCSYKNVEYGNRNIVAENYYKMGKEFSKYGDEDFVLFINDDIETYLGNFKRIKDNGYKCVKCSYLNNSISKQILDSFRVFCDINNITIISSEELLEVKDEIDDELINIAKNDIRVKNFVNFRTIDFYKNPDIDKELIKISQGQIIKEIITQAENSYELDNKKKRYRDLFITAATGAGKSVIFTVPAVYLAKKYNKLTIVIEPVKSLMQEQRDKLINNGYNRVASYNSDLNTQVEKEEEVILLKAPTNNQCYEYIGQQNLVIEQDSDIKEVKDNKGKNFHADTYIFDSKPERERFLQALDDVDVAECYFTGMFTNEKTGFAVPYIDPETNTLRNYYPDFIITLVDGSYIIIEVKADFKVDDPVVKSKANATKEIMTDKGMDYMLVESSRVEKERIKFALT